VVVGAVVVGAVEVGAVVMFCSQEIAVGESLEVVTAIVVPVTPLPWIRTAVEVVERCGAVSRAPAPGRPPPVKSYPEREESADEDPDVAESEAWALPEPGRPGPRETVEELVARIAQVARVARLATASTQAATPTRIRLGHAVVRARAPDPRRNSSPTRLSVTSLQRSRPLTSSQSTVGLARREWRRRSASTACPASGAG
jgi:hypothetical protein